jgi:hypothetical protein
MARDERWKLVVQVDGTQSLFDLRGLSHEAEDLLATGLPLPAEQEDARARLVAELPYRFP